MAVNWKNVNDVILWHEVIVKLFWRRLISFIKFSCWSTFYVNIITGFEAMAISFYKRFTRNQEIVKTTVWVFPNIWRLRRVKNTKFSTNLSNKVLRNSAKCQGYSFYRFWVIKGKPPGLVGRKGGKVTPLTQIFP